ncbi:MAG: hypothetical protein ACTHQE_11780, partial [Thermomicrobiales bacterium]
IGQTVALSKRMVRIVRQNVTLSLLTKILALGLAMLGFVNLWIAVVVDVGTSLVVILNGIRLSRIATPEGVSAPVSVPMTAAPIHDAACGCGEAHAHSHAHPEGCSCGGDHHHDGSRAA